MTSRERAPFCSGRGQGLCSWKARLHKWASCQSSQKELCPERQMTDGRSERQGPGEVGGPAQGGQCRVGLGISRKGAAGTGSEACVKRTAVRCSHALAWGSKETTSGSQKRTQQQQWLLNCYSSLHKGVWPRGAAQTPWAMPFPRWAAPLGFSAGSKAEWGDPEGDGPQTASPSGEGLKHQLRINLSYLITK